MQKYLSSENGASLRKCTRIKVQHGLLTLALSEKFAGLYLPRAARFDPVFPTFHNIVRNEVTLNPNNIMRMERMKKPIIKYSPHLTQFKNMKNIIIVINIVLEKKLVETLDANRIYDIKILASESSSINTQDKKMS